MKRASTLIEILMVIVLIAIVTGIMVASLKNMTPDKNMASLKKAYYTTEKIVFELIQDGRLYPYAKGFAYTAPATIDGVTYVGGSKFRDAFKSKLNIFDDNISSNGSIFKTNDDIWWHIPDTVFSELYPETQNYIPISLIPASDKLNAETRGDDFESIAKFGMGIRIYGNGKMEVIDATQNDGEIQWTSNENSKKKYNCDHPDKNPYHGTWNVCRMADILDINKLHGD